jgi:hypothetical protein
MTETSLYFIVSIVLLIRMVILEKKMSAESELVNELANEIHRCIMNMYDIHRIHDTRITNIEKALRAEPDTTAEQTIK